MWAAAWRCMRTRYVIYDECVSLHDHSEEACPFLHAWPNPACKHSSVCMLWCQHKYTHSTCHSHMHAHTHTHTHQSYTLQYTFPPHTQSTRPFCAHRNKHYYTHTVNLTPCSNAERIVPGLGDIKSLDYPIKSYSTSSPAYAKSVEQTIAPHHEGRG